MGQMDGQVKGTTKIWSGGLDALRWNLVLVAEGYQEGELGQFAADAQNFLTRLLATQPFTDNQDAINVYRIDVASTNSGADDPAIHCQDDPPGFVGSGAAPATFFDASFCTVDGHGKEVRRLLRVNNDTVLSVLDQAHTPWQQVVVVVNDPAHYGGSGGQIAVVSTKPATTWPDVSIHEMGHSYFKFADEYSELVATATAPSASEPAAANATAVSVPDNAKWRDLMATPAPATVANPDLTCSTANEVTPFPAGTVGLFEGADRYHCRRYRPEHNCRMRDNAAPFCAVCRRYIRHRLARFTGPQLQAGSRVAAANRNPGQLDLFVVGADGTVCTVWWMAGVDQDQWNRWFRIGTGSFSPASGVTALARTDPFPGRLDLLVVAPDGVVHTNAWSSSQPWADAWTPIGSGVALPAGGRVTAVSRNPTMIDAFAVDSTGAVLTIFSVNGVWSPGWFRIGAETFPPGSTVTAIARQAPGTDGALDLFVQGSDGRIYHNFWSSVTPPGPFWRPNWQPIGNDVFAPGTVVAAAARTPSNLDLFAVAADGSVRSAFWGDPTPAGTWSAWFPVAPVRAAAGASVCAVSRSPGNLDLFLVADGGQVLTTSWTAGGGWNPAWAPVASGKSSTQLALSAVARAADHLDLFIAGNPGGVFSSFWPSAFVPGGGWNFWWRI